MKHQIGYKTNPPKQWWRIPPPSLPLIPILSCLCIPKNLQMDSFSFSGNCSDYALQLVEPKSEDDDDYMLECHELKDLLEEK